MNVGRNLELIGVGPEGVQWQGHTPLSDLVMGAAVGDLSPQIRSESAIAAAAVGRLLFPA